MIPDTGHIRLLGLDWRTHSPQIREHIGIQFQSTQLDEKIKVREVLELYSRFVADWRVDVWHRQPGQ